jgi:hypothetical protein
MNRKFRKRKILSLWLGIRFLFDLKNKNLIPSELSAIGFFDFGRKENV